MSSTNLWSPLIGGGSSSPGGAFRCQYRGWDMCFFGGVCEIDASTREERCVCPEGYGPDTATYLFNHNCTMPRYTLELFCVLFTMIWFPVLVAFDRKRRAIKRNPHLLELARITLAAHLMLGIVIIGYLVQGGMFEISSTAAICFFTLAALLLIKVLLFLLSMSHPGGSGQLLLLKRRMDWAMNLLVGGNFVFGVPVVVSRRTKYADLCMDLATSLIAAFTTAFGVLAWKHAQEFIRELQRSSLSSTIPRRIPRSVTRMQRNLGIYCVSVLSGTLFMVVCRFLWGSVPFLYLYVFPCIVASNLVPLGVASLFAGEETRRSKLHSANVLESGEEAVNRRRDDEDEDGALGEAPPTATDDDGTQEKQDGRRRQHLPSFDAASSSRQPHTADATTYDDTHNNNNSDSGHSGYDVGAAVEQHFE